VKVPFLDIPAENRSIAEELRAAVDPVIEHGKFILGPACEQFESDFAAYCGAKYCVGLNSGTSALHMALVACDVGPGDEVITTPHTWISTAWAISYVGARPVFVDIDPVTFNLDPKLVEAALTARTKVLLPVHLYGQLADVDALAELAERHELLLIEDAAQAHGAKLGERRAGSFGRAACFSFYPGKNLGAFGEGGAVVTDDEELAARIRRLRDHAQDGRHHHVELGFNTRMEGIQAAVLKTKLPHLDAWNDARRRHATRYAERLWDIPGVELPQAPVASAHVWHLYAVLVRGGEREAVRAGLSERGVASGIHYPTPVPYQPAYRELGYRRGDFPVAENVMDHCLSLPMFAGLSDEQLQHVAESLREVMSEASASPSGAVGRPPYN